MKQSWIIGTVMLWMTIFTSELMATGGTILSGITGFNSIASPAFVNSSNAISNAATILVNIGSFFVALVKAFFLYSPTVFAGTWLWFWEFVCFPISISFIVVIATILRGVHST